MSPLKRWLENLHWLTKILQILDQERVYRVCESLFSQLEWSFPQMRLDRTWQHRCGWLNSAEITYDTSQVPEVGKKFWYTISAPLKMPIRISKFNLDKYLNLVSVGYGSANFAIEFDVDGVTKKRLFLSRVFNTLYAPCNRNQSILCAKNLWKSFSFIEDGCAIYLLGVEALSTLTVSTYNDCESNIFSLIFISHHFKPISVNFGLELFLLDAGTLEQRLTCEINYCLGSTDNNGDFTPDNLDCIPLAPSCVKTSSSFQWSLLWWIYKNPFWLDFFGVLIKKWCKNANY